MVRDFALALVAESVDALDLKSNRGSPSVPVQVWPGANLKKTYRDVGLFFNFYSLYCTFFFLFLRAKEKRKYERKKKRRFFIVSNGD